MEYELYMTASKRNGCFSLNMWPNVGASLSVWSSKEVVKRQKQTNTEELTDFFEMGGERRQKVWLVAKTKECDTCM